MNLKNDISKHVRYTRKFIEKKRKTKNQWAYHKSLKRTTCFDPPKRMEIINAYADIFEIENKCTIEQPKV